MSESEQKESWKIYDGAEGLMTKIMFGPSSITVARPTVSAWNALETILAAHEYSISGEDTHGFHSGGTDAAATRSLHAFGIAIDLNPATNPAKKTPDRRAVWFSTKPTQAERAQDVALNAADTDMTPAMIADVRAVKTRQGKPVFGWGGDWEARKSPMHFYIDVSPEELAAGIDTSTVKRERSEADHDCECQEKNEPTDDVDDDFPVDDGWRDEEMISSSQVRRFRPFLDFIAMHEGTANRHPVQSGEGNGYDTSLSYGRFTGGEKPLSRMTLAQIDSLQSAMLRHPANNFNSSALGRYQIVRKTLRGLKRQMGLSDDLTYSGELQDRLAVALIMRRGRDVTGLRLEWASLQRVSAREILAAYDETSTEMIVPDDQQPSWNVEQWTPKTFIERFIEALAGTRPIRIGDGEDSPAQLVLKPGDRGPEVTALQEALNARNYKVGKIDGIYGTLTTAAVAAFQVDYKVPASTPGAVDSATWSMLREAPGRPLSEERRNATAKDLRNFGSRTIAEADKARLVAIITSLFGGVGVSRSMFDSATAGTPQKVDPITTSAVDLTPLQQVATALKGFSTNDLRTVLDLSPSHANLLQRKIHDASLTVPVAQPQAHTVQPDPGNWLVPLITTGANILLPGAGGSLAILAMGLASYLFGTRIINRRVEDQRNGSNIGAQRR